MSTDTETAPLFELRNLTLDFGEGPLFSPLTETFFPGERIQLKAESGGGKSSLFKALLGFIPPAGGDLLYRGESQIGSDYRKVRSELFYVPQNPALFAGTPQDAWEECAEFKANRRHWAGIEEFRAMLARFDLPKEVLQAEFTSLSGGEKQRVVLALGAASGRKVFLLDEALAGLDSRRREQVLGYYTSREAWTLVLISHDTDTLLPGSRTLELTPSPSRKYQ